MTEKTDKAVKELTIQSVQQKGFEVVTRDDYDHEEFKESLFKYAQAYRKVSKIQEFVHQEEAQDKTVFVYKFYYSLGLRFLDGSDVASDEEKVKEDLKPLLEFKSNYCAQYISKEKIESDQCSDFAQQYVPFHVWPYWREFVQTSCARIGVQPFNLPPYRV